MSDRGIIEFTGYRIYAFTGYPKVMMLQELNDGVWYQFIIEQHEGSSDVEALGEWIREEMNRSNKVVAELPTEYCI